MDRPLLQTKFFIPAGRLISAKGFGTSHVPRPRLVELLNEGLGGKITLISAPAGFGKTTLVSDWLEQVNLPAAWLSLDEDDNDFARFWAYCIVALQTLHPEIGTNVLPVLKTVARPPAHELLTLLINDLAAIPKQSILVLDDYHTIESESIDRALTFFIDHLPPRLHLLITSRADPNLSLAKLRARGQLNELRGADLRFNIAETAQFLEQMTGLSLTTSEVASLDQRTEGWIAGLQMTALSLRQREAADISQFIEDLSGSHRFIMDYLADEVLKGQSTEVQTFLLYTSILERLCGPLCEALLPGDVALRGGQESPSASSAPGPSTAQELLEYLEQANLFIQPLDDQRHWYRYHPLFSSLLRQRLQQNHPDQVASLHLTASQWYQEAGFTASAVHHALSAKAFGIAASLIEQVAPAMIQHSELARLLNWLNALPDDVVQARPQLELYYIQVLIISGEVKPAAVRLKAIEENLAVDEASQTPEVLGYTAALRAFLLREAGDFSAAIALSRQALIFLQTSDSHLRDMVTLNLAVAYYFQDEFKLASQLLRETITASQTVHRPMSTLAAIYLYTQLLRAQGSLSQALQICQEGLELVAVREWHNFPAVGNLYIALGDLFRERNELTKGAEYLEKGIKLGQDGGLPHILILGNVWLAWLRQAQKDVIGSQKAIRTALQIDQQHEVSRFWPLPYAACYQARLWIVQGNLRAASHWAQVSGLIEADHPLTYLHELQNLTLARLLIAQDNLEKAEALLHRLNQVASSAGRNGSLIEILILQAITFAGQKRLELALTVLGQALDLAEPEGYTRLFLDEGAPITVLLRQAVAQDRHASYALHLLSAIGDSPANALSLAEPLTERELEILRRVAAGYSNQEIAQELVVAAGTVKKHISNIYSKLEVGSRTQAVARARQSGIL